MPKAIVAAQALLVERRPFGDVAGRLFEREFEHAQRNVERLADLVDRRAAGGEVGDHRLRHRLRERRDALGDDAVIAGEYCDQRRIGVRPGRPLPAGEPFGDLFEAPERACRLRQLRLALADRGDRRGVRLRHGGKQCADIVKGASGGVHA